MACLEKISMLKNKLTIKRKQSEWTEKRRGSSESGGAYEVDPTVGGNKLQNRTGNGASVLN
jgi:hypothetical protein